ncbi:T6SS amidase immunity protein Tai4 family protein, partial [Pseudomonas syringae]
EKNWEHSIKLQLPAGNVGFMRRLHYTNPLAESQIKGIKFDLLKCLDMYHSKELDTLTKKLVTHPNHTYMKNIKQP